MDNAGHTYNIYSQKVFGTAAINLGFLCGVIGLFAYSVLSRWPILQASYDTRRRLREQIGADDVNQVPPKDLSQLFVLFHPLPLGNLELLRIAGLDGVVAVRFAMMCLRFCLFNVVVALGLCWLYLSGPDIQGKHDLQSIQMSNQRGPLVQFVATGAAWWFALMLMFLLSIEYKHFSLLRLAYFTGEHLEDNARRKRDYYQRTVLVERVPNWINTHAGLRVAFEELFDDEEVERAVLCTDVTALRRVVALHTHLQEEEEVWRSVKRGGSITSAMRIAHKFGGLHLLRVGRFLGPCTLQLPSERMALVEGDAKRLYQDLISSVGDSDDYGPKDHLQKLRRGKTELFMLKKLSEHHHHHSEDENLPAIPLPLRYQPSEQRRNEAVQRSGFGCITRFYIRCCCEDLGGLASGWQRPGRRAHQLLPYLFLQMHGGRVGFVTFRSRCCRATAIRVTLHQSSKSMVAQRAPFPKDVIWENLSRPEGQLRARTIFSLGVLLVTLLLWSTIAALIQAIANLETIHGWMRTAAPWLCQKLYVERFFGWAEDQWWWVALNGFLPALALSLLLVALPPIVRAWCHHYELYRARSSIMLQSVRVCFLFNIVTMYVTAFSGSFLQSGFLQSGSPFQLTAGVMQGAAKKLDDVSGYLICYILTKLGVRMLVYLCRPYAVLPWCLYTLLGHALAVCSSEPRMQGSERDPFLPKHQEAVAKQFLKEPPCYDWILTDLSIILALCTMYGIMSPALILAALPFFWVYAAMVRYNVIFVYTQEYDSGGELFFALVDMTFCSLLLSLLLLQAYLASLHDTTPNFLSSLVWRLSIPTLMVVVLMVWRHLHKRYTHVCRGLSLQLAKELDAALQPGERQPAVTGAAYEDPVVHRTRALAGDTRLEEHIWRHRLIGERETQP